MRETLVWLLYISKKKFFITALLFMGLAVVSLGQSRDFLFNNGINYLLADKEIAIKQFTAINDFNKVNKLDTNVKVVHAYKGFAYRQLGDSEKSLAAFSLYMNSQEDLSALDYRLIGKAKMEVGDVDGALKEFESAL